MIYGDKNKVTVEIENLLKSNQLLLKFLYYVNDSEMDVVEAPNLTIDQLIEVANDCIYREMRLPADISEEVKCYLCMEYMQKTYHQERNTFFNGNIFVIRVVCHKDCRETVNGDRVYAIEECIVKTFEGAKVGTTSNVVVIDSNYSSINNTDYNVVDIRLGFVDFNGDKYDR